MSKRTALLSLILFATIALGAAPQGQHLKSAERSSTSPARESRRIRPHVSYKRAPAAAAARLRESFRLPSAAEAGNAGAVAARVKKVAGGVMAEIEMIGPEVAILKVNPDGTTTVQCGFPLEPAKAPSAKEDEGSRQ